MDKCILVYWNKTIDQNEGKFKGDIFRILHTEDIPEDDNPDLSYTYISADFQLIGDLLCGIISVDVEKTTLDFPIFSNKKQQLRFQGTQIVLQKGDDWKRNSLFQKPAPMKIYQNYIEAYLSEITNLTKHLSIEQKIELLPPSFIEPCSVNAFIGKDGIAMKYEWPTRPEEIDITIDLNSIVDELLFPHPLNKTYNLPSPYILWNRPTNGFTATIDQNGFFQEIPYGQPYVVMMQKDLRMFYINCNIRRAYNTGETSHFKEAYVELLGDISRRNFTKEIARKRAKDDVERWLSNSVKYGTYNTAINAKYSEMKAKFDEFKQMIYTESKRETQIDKFLCENDWILIRGLNCKSFKSSVSIPKDITESNEKTMIPDRFIEGHDGYWDIVDLKLPFSKLIVNKTNREHFYSNLTEYEAQVYEYVDTSKQTEVKKYLREKEGILIKHPKGIIVGGRRPTDTKTLEKLENCKDRFYCDLITYDELIDSVEQVLSLIEDVVAS